MSSLAEMRETPEQSPKLTVEEGRGAPAGSNTAPASPWRSYVNGLVAVEISRVTRYYNRLIQWRRRPNDSGILLEAIDAPAKSEASSLSEFPVLKADLNDRTAVLLNGNINHDYDIQRTLQMLKGRLTRTSRIVLVAYNPYYRWLYRAANTLGLRKGEQPDTFVTHTDLHNIARISGFDVVKVRPVAYFPFKLFGVGDFINRVLPSIPVARWLGAASVIVLRPILAEREKPSLSVIIPARNEKGNIENALKRMPEFGGADLEVIFVEGHSSDDTWGEIQRVCATYKDSFQLQMFQQTGKGKSDAVRLGFSKATKELLVILDADLTMPPELLERFYNAYIRGDGDFINGSRLVYPMEGEAMRFLNHLGNIFFAKALSFVLDSRIGDSLCGTKLLSRTDYDRFIAWRQDFGDFDPFGDYELLFPASDLGLGIIDIPIRYRDRTYGATNISRFRHGAMLLKMTFIGFMKIKLGRISGYISGSN